MAHGVNIDDVASETASALHMEVVTSRNEHIEHNSTLVDSDDKNATKATQPTKVSTNTTPRGPSLRYPRGSEKKTGSVFFAEKSTHVPMLVKQDTIHSSVSEDETLTNQNDGGALTQRERAEFGYFDSLQSRAGAGQGDETHQYGSIAVSDGGGYAELAATSRKKSTSRSPQIGGIRKGGTVTARCQSPDDAGLIFIGQHVHSMQEHFDKKAE